MREILFRGKRLDNGEWAYGSLVKADGGTNHGECYILNTPADFSYGDGGRRVRIGCFVEVHPRTIGQYTGMRDSNGKQIFEGDILFFDYIGENLGVRGKATVVFQDGKFGVLWGYRKELVALDGFANVTVEVIGNIYDNNELLEGVL